MKNETHPCPLHLTGIQNFFDIGGSSTIGGGHVARHRVYRSGQVEAATETDLQLLAGLDLSAVFDLRSRSDHSSPPSHNILGRSTTVHVRDANPGSHLLQAKLDLGDGNLEQRWHARAVRYATMPYQPDLVRIFRQFFKVLANARGGVLAFCMSGKNETGLLVALLQSVLGVHRDDIFADYAFIGSASLPQDHPASGSRILDSEEVDIRLLEVAFNRIDECHGRIERYCREILGVTPDVLSRLNERLIV